MDNINSQLTLASSIEAILFYTAEPMSLKKLATLTKTSIDDVKAAVLELKERLEASNGGIKLLTQNNEVVLGTTPEASNLIEQITRDEISKELSKAALETLSIICYKGPLTRADIDYVRGVNSTFIIRNLLIRGIVEKLENPRDARASLYGATFAALEYMGVTKKEDLPRYEEIQAQMQAFLAEKQEDDSVEAKDKNDESKEDDSNDSEDSENEAEENQDEGDDAALEDAISEDDELLDSEVPFDEEGNDSTLGDNTQEDMDLVSNDSSDDVDADVSEENEMGTSYDDSEIKEHLNEDVLEEKIEEQNN